MLETTLGKMADKILALDEASLTSLWEKYKLKMEKFEPTKEWERSVIIFFMINSVRVKNHIFNERILQAQHTRPVDTPPPKGKPSLKRVK